MIEGNVGVVYGPRLLLRSKSMGAFIRHLLVYAGLIE